jgi:hypothetical protein
VANHPPEGQTAAGKGEAPYVTCDVVWYKLAAWAVIHTQQATIYYVCHLEHCALLTSLTAGEVGNGYRFRAAGDSGDTFYFKYTKY